MLFMNRHLKLDPNAQAGSPTADAAGAAGSDAPTAETAESNGSQPTFTQADLDRILADRLSRQEKKLRRELEDQTEKAKEKELADAAEWQTLAEKRQNQLAKLEAKLAELEQQAETADKYGKALETYVAQLADGLPAPILSLLEGMDQAAKLEWLAANRAQFVTADEPEAETAAPKRPLPSTPAPSANSTKMTPEERRRKAARTW